MIYKFNAWVHPKKGGDDYSISGHVEVKGGIEDADRGLMLAKKEVQKILKKEGSAMLSDYQITSFS